MEVTTGSGKGSCGDGSGGGGAGCWCLCRLEARRMQQVHLFPYTLAASCYYGGWPANDAWCYGRRLCRGAADCVVSARYGMTQGRRTRCGTSGGPILAIMIYIITGSPLSLRTDCGTGGRIRTSPQSIGRIPRVLLCVSYRSRFVPYRTVLCKCNVKEVMFAVTGAPSARMCDYNQG